MFKWIISSILIMGLLPQFSLAEEKSKNFYLTSIQASCEKSLLKKMAFDKAKTTCECIKNDISKLGSKKLEYLMNSYQGKKGIASLDQEQADLVGDYEAQVAAKCLGQKLATPVSPDKDKESK